MFNTEPGDDPSQQIQDYILNKYGYSCNVTYWNPNDVLVEHDFTRCDMTIDQIIHQFHELGPIVKPKS